MDKLKYIVLKDNGVEFAVVFPAVTEHKFVAGDKKVLGAGFCSLKVENGKVKFSVWGESFGLKIKSRGEEDEWMLQTAIIFNNKGFTPVPPNEKRMVENYLRAEGLIN